MGKIWNVDIYSAKYGIKFVLAIIPRVSSLYTSRYNGPFEYPTYLLTYSMVQSPSLEANWFAASQEIPRISRNPKVHYRTHKRPSTVSILSQPSPVHIPTFHLLEIRPNIIHPSTPRSPQRSLSLRFYVSNTIFKWELITVTFNLHVIRCKWTRDFQAELIAFFPVIPEFINTFLMFNFIYVNIVLLKTT